MKAFAHVAAVFFAACFILTTAAALLLYNIEQRMFEPNIYKRALLDQRLYERLPALIAEQVLQSTQGDPKYSFMNALKPGDVETVFRTLLPPEDLRQLTEATLDQLFGYLNGNVADPRISMQVLKDRLNKNGVDAVLQVMRAQAPCTDAQLVGMLGAVATGSQAIQMCNPPDLVKRQITPYLQGFIEGNLKAIPDTVPLLQNGEQRDPAPTIRLMRLVLRLSPVVPIGFLLLATWLAIRSLKGWLNWWGIPLLVGGLFSFIIGLASVPLTSLMVNRFVLPQIPSYLSNGIIQVITGVITSVAEGLARPILLEAAVLTLIGLGATIAGRFAKPEPDEAV
jgi:hypothetical protein